MNQYEVGALWRDEYPAANLPVAERVYRVRSVSPTGNALVENVSRPGLTMIWTPNDGDSHVKVASTPVYLVDLDPLLTKRVGVVLVDGGRREGILTRVEYAEIEFNGLVVRRPDRLVWDYDGSDWMTWDMIVALKVVE